MRRSCGARSEKRGCGQIEGKKVLIQTIKDRKEKFGRYLAEIWLEADDGSRVNINDLLVQQGHAIYQEY